MNKDLLRTGDKGHIKFRFMYRPEYLKPGTTILFREGRTKGLGVVTTVTPSTGYIPVHYSGKQNRIKN
jgi:GTPase